MRSTSTSLSNDPVIGWLLKGDVTIQYQVYRDLFQEKRKELRDRIAREGWGKAYLDRQRPDGHWGLSFYQPKWTSTHYTLLELRNMYVSPANPSIQQIITTILREEIGNDGGINPARTVGQSDVCINGMVLNYACYFKAAEPGLKSIVDFILGMRMPDGGFNCRMNRSGAVHSSLHTTLSVAEGIRQYHKEGYRYRLDELLEAEQGCRDFMLQHQLFKSDRTGEIIHPAFLRLAYPCRWRYDILRALEYFRISNVTTDRRLVPALEVLIKKKRKDGTWTASKHQGATHMEMEQGRKPSRWNTMRALRVLHHFENLFPVPTP